MISRPARIRVFVSAVLTAAILAALTSPATANIKILVNQEPITAYDISQRAKLLRLTSRGKKSTKAARKELIDEAIQLQEAKKYSIIVDQKQVEKTYSNIAKNIGSKRKLEQALRQGGVRPETLKKRLKAQLLWNNVLRSRYAARLQGKTSDITTILKRGSADASAKSTKEYELARVIFVSPKSKGNKYKQKRKREASAFRKKFVGCDGAIQQVLKMNAVIYKRVGLRELPNLPETTQKNLKGIKVGSLTKPQLTENGVEMLAVCNIRTVASDTAARVEASKELSLSANTNSKVTEEIMAELREKAIIVNK